ncbi:hypothetical protein OG225_10690 [Nocardia sp. NBC_01377]|uniref:hypothetical protein n=1 Tax=Nocardia sp. NBC_01377 TaxID=2903595 RepID=UPI003245D90A
MPDGYDRDRDKFDSNQRGRIFENGTARFFRDSENGYAQESSTYRSDIGKIKFDKVKQRDGLTYTIEEKSGRIEGQKDRRQLEVVRELIESGKVHKHILRSVEGESISPDIRELVIGLVGRI